MNNNKKRNVIQGSLYQTAATVMLQLEHPVKYIVLQKVAKLVESVHYQQQQQQFKQRQPIIYNQAKTTKWVKLKLNFKNINFYFKLLIYGLCTCRLLLYAYLNLSKTSDSSSGSCCKESYPLYRYDIFWGAFCRASMSLDRVLLLSLTGVPLFASTVHYLIDWRIGGGGKNSNNGIKPKKMSNTSSFALHLYDVINRNAAQMEEAIVRSGNSSGYLAFTYPQLTFGIVATTWRFIVTLMQLYSGRAPLASLLKPLRLYPHLPLYTRQRIIFFVVGLESCIRIMYYVSGRDL